MRVLFVEVVPELEQRDEIRIGIGETRMFLVGCGLMFQRPFARVLAGQRGGDYQHFMQAGLVARGDQHAADARIDRQMRQLLADAGQSSLFIQCAEFGQQLLAVADALRFRRVEEREVVDLRQAQRLHAQDHAGKRRTQQFRRRVFWPRQKILLVIQPDADAFRHATATAGALVGGRLRDLLDLQLLDLVADGISLHPRQAGIDNVADARHGERGFRHIGGQHDAAAAVRFEDLFLLADRKAREQRQYFGVRRVMLAQRFLCIANLAFARQEHQDVAGAIGREFIDGMQQG